MQLCESCEEPLEVQSAVRKNNRVLRRIVSTLRHRVQNQKAYQDTLFVELCSTSPSAEQAMRRLWEEGGFQPPCGPEDYDTIVDAAIRALIAYRAVAAESAASRGPEPAD